MLFPHATGAITAEVTRLNLFQMSCLLLGLLAAILVYFFFFSSSRNIPISHLPSAFPEYQSTMSNSNWLCIKSHSVVDVDSPEPEDDVNTGSEKTPLIPLPSPSVNSTMSASAYPSDYWQQRHQILRYFSKTGFTAAPAIIHRNIKCRMDNATLDKLTRCFALTTSRSQAYRVEQWPCWASTRPSPSQLKDFSQRPSSIKVSLSCHQQSVCCH